MTGAAGRHHVRRLAAEVLNAPDLHPGVVKQERLNTGMLRHQCRSVTWRHSRSSRHQRLPGLHRGIGRRTVQAGESSPHSTAFCCSLKRMTSCQI